MYMLRAFHGIGLKFCLAPEARWGPAPRLTPAPGPLPLLPPAWDAPPRPPQSGASGCPAAMPSPRTASWSGGLRASVLPRGTSTLCPVFAGGWCRGRTVSSRKGTPEPCPQTACGPYSEIASLQTHPHVKMRSPLVWVGPKSDESILKRDSRARGT